MPPPRAATASLRVRPKPNSSSQSQVEHLRTFGAFPCRHQEDLGRKARLGQGRLHQGTILDGHIAVRDHSQPTSLVSALSVHCCPACWSRPRLDDNVIRPFR